MEKETEELIDAFLEAKGPSDPDKAPPSSLEVMAELIKLGESVSHFNYFPGPEAYKYTAAEIAQHIAEANKTARATASTCVRDTKAEALEEIFSYMNNPDWRCYVKEITEGPKKGKWIASRTHRDAWDM